MIKLTWLSYVCNALLLNLGHHFNCVNSIHAFCVTDSRKGICESDVKLKTRNFTDRPVTDSYLSFQLLHRKSAK